MVTSVTLSLSVLGQEHPNTQRDLPYLVEVLRNVGKESEAARFESLVLKKTREDVDKN